MIITEDLTELLDYIKKVKTSRNYKEYKELFDSLKKVNFSVKILKIENSLKESITVDSSFFFDDILENVNDLTKHKYIVFETNGSTIHLNVYYTDEDLRKFLNRTIEAICFLFNMSQHTTKVCTFNYYLVENKKKLQDKNYLQDHLTQKKLILVVVP